MEGLGIPHQRAAYQVGWVDAGMYQDMGRQRRGGGFAMGACHHDAVLVTNAKGSHRLRHGHDLEPSGARIHGFGVAGTDDIANDHQIGMRLQVLRIEAAEHLDAPGGQLCTHGRINMLVAATHVVALTFEQACERPDAGAADTDKIDVFHPQTDNKNLRRDASNGRGGLRT